MTRRAKPVAIDLFSGCGGLTHGLTRAGFSVLGAIEIDDLAVETYRLNHPEVRVWESDIRAVTPRAMARALKIRKGELDLLAGCPPCQGFSSMRTLNGRTVRDDRNDLVLEFVRFATYLFPKGILMENVAGLERDRRLNSLVRHLRKLGYEVEWRVVDAASFRVPQRRRRLVLMGSRGQSVEFPSPAATSRTVRDAIGALREPGASRDPLHDILEHRSRQVQELIARIPKDGGSRAALGPEGQLDCHASFDGFHDVYGRMAWDDVSPTITSGCVNPSKGRFLHPEQNRAITLREAALLQGFPKKYKFSLRRGKFAAAEMIGNALPPPFVEAHARVMARMATQEKSL